MTVCVDPSTIVERPADSNAVNACVRWCIAFGSIAWMRGKRPAQFEGRRANYASTPDVILMPGQNRVDVGRDLQRSGTTVRIFEERIDHRPTRTVIVRKNSYGQRLSDALPCLAFTLLVDHSPAALYL